MGGILLFSPTVWAGSGGLERRDTQRNTHRNVHANVAPTGLPFSDLPLKKCPKNIRIVLLQGQFGEMSLLGHRHPFFSGDPTLRTVKTLSSQKYPQYCSQWEFHDQL